MDKLLDIIAQWQPLGQGIFLFFALVMVLATINFAFKMLVVLVRGWPPVESEEKETED